MSKIEGEFSSKQAARGALEALKAAGIQDGHVKVWNIIPESPKQAPAPVSNSGAVTGVLLGGFTGLALGAAIDRLRAPYGHEHHIPDPTGVRVVVEGSTGIDVAEILLKNGAANVR